MNNTLTPERFNEIRSAQQHWIIFCDMECNNGVRDVESWLHHNGHNFECFEIDMMDVRRARSRKANVLLMAKASVDERHANALLSIVHEDAPPAFSPNYDAAIVGVGQESTDFLRSAFECAIAGNAMPIIKDAN